MAACTSFTYSTKTTIKMGVLDLCSSRNDPQEVNKIIQEYKSIGLSDAASLQQNLSQGEYVKILQHVWAERDRQYRLDWLRNNAGLHAPLLYELAISEFVMSPAVETINLISLPLLAAASFRVRQDSQCFESPKIKFDSSDQLWEEVYRKSLNTQTVKFLKMPLASILETHIEERNQAIMQKVEQTARASMTTSLPNPAWIGEGLISLFVKWKMEAPEKHKELTDQYATSVLKRPIERL